MKDLINKMHMWKALSRYDRVEYMKEQRFVKYYKLGFFY
jgi:hypothetical protein